MLSLPCAAEGFSFPVYSEDSCSSVYCDDDGDDMSWCHVVTGLSGLCLTYTALFGVPCILYTSVTVYVLIWLRIQLMLNVNITSDRRLVNDRPEDDCMCVDCWWPIYGPMHSFVIFLNKIADIEQTKWTSGVALHKFMQLLSVDGVQHPVVIKFLFGSKVSRPKLIVWFRWGRL